MDLLFVHGTGVREGSLLEQWTPFEQGMKAACPAIRPQPLVWGPEVGTPLVRKFASVPDYPERGGSPHTAADSEDDRIWGILQYDPLAELRMISAQEPRSLSPFGIEAKRQFVERNFVALATNESVCSLLNRPGCDDVRQAIDAIRASDCFRPLIGRLGANVDWPRKALVRALLAHLPGANSQLWPRFAPDKRRQIVEQIAPLVHPAEGAMVDRMQSAMVDLYVRLGVFFAQRTYGGVVDYAHQMLGDVLRYQKSGGELRSAIQSRLAAAAEGLVLVGHSLGGIACFEALVDLAVRAAGGDEGAARSLAKAPLLVTVGSQSGFLYELDALMTLRHTAPLPPGFPPWVNIYDPDDWLAFLAQPVFGEQSTDHAVHSGQHFPHSHLAYFQQPRTYLILAEALARLTAPAGKEAD